MHSEWIGSGVVDATDGRNGAQVLHASIILAVAIAVIWGYSTFLPESNALKLDCSHNISADGR